MTRHFLLAVLMLFALASFNVGCRAHYVTPNQAADLDMIPSPNIRETFAMQPAAPFPARLAVIRVQAPEFRSRSRDADDDSKYSVVFTRDRETDASVRQLSEMDMVAGVASINRLVTPAVLRRDADLRQAAAAVHADLLLLYTFDTRSRINDHEVGPLGLITLGFLPNQTAEVTTTASAVIMDVRTGFVYGLAEASAERSQLTNYWSSHDAVEDCRVKTESESLEKLVPEVQAVWAGILREHTNGKTAG